MLCLGFSGRWPQRAPSRELVLRYPRGASLSRVADSLSRGPAARSGHSRVLLPGCGWARLCRGLHRIFLILLFIYDVEDSFPFFEASSFASEISPLCGVAHSPCHRVGLTQHVLRGYCILYHVRDDFSYASRHFQWSWCWSFFLLRRSIGTRCSRRHRRTLCRFPRPTCKTRLCFVQPLKIMAVLLWQKTRRIGLATEGREFRCGH